MPEIPPTSYTCWSRLEPRVRSNDFIDNLQCRIADPLWLLGRQWQVNEFKGEDAGSLVDAKMRANVYPVVKYGPRNVDGTTQTIDEETAFRSPSSNGDDYNQWSYPARAYTNDGSYAFSGFINSMHDWYGFNLDIPSDCLIKGIQVDLRASSDTIFTQEVDISLSWNGGSSYTSAKRLSWSGTTLTYKSAGNATDNWGRAWAPTELSNANLRVRLTKISLFGYFRCDHIRIKVFYSRYASVANGVAYNPNRTPLEVLVERETTRAVGAPEEDLGKKDLYTACEAGAHFQRLLKFQLEDIGSGNDYRQDLVNLYPVDLIDEDADSNGTVSIDAASRRFVKVMSRRVPNGFLIERALRGAVDADPPDLPSEMKNVITDEDDRQAAIAAGQAWLTWWDSLMSEVEDEDSAWVEERMEYAFDVAVDMTDQELVLSADEYPGGRLDWYAFDARPGLDLNGPAAEFPWQNEIEWRGIPTPIHFPGMPVHRWWEMEEGRVDLSRVEAAADDLGRMILMEFSLIYSNDWRLIPMDLPIGSVCRVEEIEVTDTFGTKVLIPHPEPVGDSNEEWGMYQLSSRKMAGAEDLDRPLFFMPPVLGQIYQSEILERIHFLRDEMANMAWAVERTVPSPLGRGMSRLEEEKTRRRKEAGTSAPNLDLEKTPRYRLGTAVPRYWIPLLPVPAAGGENRKNLLLRGAMLDPYTKDKILAHGTILKPEATDLSEIFKVWDEEVPRDGAHVTRRFEFARWNNCSTHLWVGRRKRPGRGEGSSRLEFDALINLPKEEIPEE